MKAECSPPDNTAILSGNYQFGYSPECRDEDEDACQTFMDSLGDSDVLLEVDADFVDDCSVDLFEVTFAGELEFYQDAAFAEVVSDTSDPFVIGQDTIYGKATVSTPN